MSPERIGPKSSRYRGVHWCSSKNLWRAEIEVRGERRKLGRFATEVEAARAYDSAAAKAGVPERCNWWWEHGFDVHPRTFKRRQRRRDMRISRG